MPTNEGRRLQRRAIALAKSADRFSARFARQLAGVYRGIEREIAILVTQSGPIAGPAQIRLAEAVAIRTQVAAILQHHDYAGLIQAATDKPLLAIAERVRLMRLAAAPVVAPQVAALQQIHALELLDEYTRLRDVLQRSAVRGLVANTPRAELIADLAKTIDRSEATATTLYDTTVSIFGREVEAVTADPSPKTLFIYLGPVDGVTRPFCLRYAGRVLERREIDKLDNGQMGSPFLTGGGWRCRHQWTEISPASELADLHGTRKRLPEMAEDLKRQRKARAS